MIFCMVIPIRQIQNVEKWEFSKIAATAIASMRS
jgi:hypothetical protein